jgi:hypothetical protein
VPEQPACNNTARNANTNNANTGEHFVGAGPTRSARLNGRLRRSAPLTAWAAHCPHRGHYRRRDEAPGRTMRGRCPRAPGPHHRSRSDRRTHRPETPAERSSPVDNTRAAARAVLVKGAKRRRRREPLMRASTSPHWGWRWVRATVRVGAPGRCSRRGNVQSVAPLMTCFAGTASVTRAASCAAKLHWRRGSRLARVVVDRPVFATPRGWVGA